MYIVHTDMESLRLGVFYFFFFLKDYSVSLLSAWRKEIWLLCFSVYVLLNFTSFYVVFYAHQFQKNVSNTRIGQFIYRTAAS